MLWQDILIDRHLDDQALTVALTTLLPVNPSNVRIIHDAEDIAHFRDSDVHLVCTRSPANGDFVLGLQFYILDAELKHWVGEQDNQSLIRRLAEITHCSILVDDGTSNPFSWLLVRASGTVNPVLLDAQRLDQGEYVIAADISADALTSD